jgi:hypothetical protein
LNDLRCSQYLRLYTLNGWMVNVQQMFKVRKEVVVAQLEMLYRQLADPIGRAV